MRTVLVCGDRNWTDREAIRSWLCKLQDWGYDTVIEGECRGADTIARQEAKKMGFTILNRDSHTEGFPAMWGKYNKAAGVIRNREMLDQKPDLVLAFHSNIANSKGTKDCVTEADGRGIDYFIETGGQ